MRKLAPWGVGAGLLGGLTPWLSAAPARPPTRRGVTAPLIRAYGPAGRLPVEGEYPSPDRKYRAHARTGHSQVVTVTLRAVKVRKPLVSAYDAQGFAWVPGSPHRFVVATSSLYGRASLRLWEGGTRWRSLVPVRKSQIEAFTLYGVTPSGRFLIYGHTPDLDFQNQVLGRRRWLRLPPR